MSHFVPRPDRRTFLASAGLAFFATRGLFAEELAGTPSRTEGPFYPDKLPLDTDNDLITPAVGQGPNGDIPSRDSHARLPT
jgi:protocatechuate 3,4-dioxygenase beta subunit